MSAEDKILDRPPHGLEVLKLLAPLHHSLKHEPHNSESYGFSPILYSLAFHIFDKAADLPGLVELALTLATPPSPEMLKSVADSCPNLRILELAEGKYYNGFQEDGHYPAPAVSQPFYQDLNVGSNGIVSSEIYNRASHETSAYQPASTHCGARGGHPNIWQHRHF
jgi:hypothetical protein